MFNIKSFHPAMPSYVGNNNHKVKVEEISKLSWVVCVLVGLILVVLGGCTNDDPASPGIPAVEVDTTVNLLDVNDLAVLSTENTSAILTWAAPCDSSGHGRALRYDMRYATEETMLTRHWEVALEVGDLPVPSACGTQETVRVDGLDVGSTYLFGIKAQDRDSLWTDGSNSVAAHTTCNISVDAPDPGITYCTGEQMYITWEVLPCWSDNVRIDLVGKDGVVEEISASIRNDGEHAWTVTEVEPNGAYAIRVTDLFSSEYADSEGFLAIGMGCSSVTVLPDGTGDYPTIQDAVNNVPNGTAIILGDGVYRGPGNRVIQFRGKEIIVESQSGNPESCIIDCEYSGCGFWLHSGLGPGSAIRGLRITRGSGVTTWEEGSAGGGIIIEHASPTVANCIIDSCKTVDAFSNKGGGGICLYFSSSLIQDCVIVNNFTVGTSVFEADGGGIAVIGPGDSGPVRINRCTIAFNRSSKGGGLYFTNLMETPTQITNCIVAFNTGPALTIKTDDIIEFECTDIFGNTGGDWEGVFEGSLGVNGNINEDPLFCYPAGLNLTLQSTSPCIESNEGCGRIGARDIGCAGTVGISGGH